MSLARCQAFMGYLRGQNLMGPADVQRVLKQYGRLDRRLGQLAALYGFLKPEQIAQILEAQSRDSGRRFGECAVEVQAMKSEQVERVLRIQNDDLFLFSQAAVLLKLSTMDRMLKCLDEFQKDRGLTAPADYPSEEAQKATIVRVKKVLKSINAIAPLPPTAAKAMSMLNDPDVDLGKLGQVLSLDPSFVSLLLKMVNSAFYGLRSRIGNVKNALVVLGLTKLRQLILAAAVMDKFRNVPPDFSARFWERSVWAGEWAKTIGHQCRFAEADELFVAGLLHNVGELLVQQYFRAEAAAVDAQAAGGADRLEAEREHLGGTHADLGGYLFGLWQLPAEIIQSTMLHHHDLSVVSAMPNVKSQVLVVHLAGALSGIESTFDDFQFHELLDKTVGRYRGLPLQGLSTLDAGTAHDQISAAVGNIMAIFNSG
ncbi:MAG: hypothetical protein A3G34_05455 [Candidatus Lindowbacteria bacterium RIFCSPLOWO2_12_FULL_62_27]|nr:MAG: hypothetical protein A3G34_05455 [Candidatus Lindowbacteria bacterium RIFCSPLOWO2_12_FULL_62_27]